MPQARTQAADSTMFPVQSEPVHRHPINGAMRAVLDDVSVAALDMQVDVERKRRERLAHAGNDVPTDAGCHHRFALVHAEIR